MTRSTQLRDAALDAAASGLFVFPCVRRGKAPAICDWERRATRDPRQITNWWQQRPWSNIGVAVGRSGLLVIDLDMAHGELPPPEFAGAAEGRAVLAMRAARAGQPPPWGTRTIETGSGGWHLYFRAPAGVVLGNTTGALGPFVDTRGHGVVAAVGVSREVCVLVEALLAVSQWLGSSFARVLVPRAVAVAGITSGGS